MPLGNARDFGIIPEDDPILPADEQARIAAELGTGENLSEDTSTFDDPMYEIRDAFENAEVGESQEPSLDELMAYLESMKPEYPVTPTDLVVLKNEGIITVEEARTYLEGKGVLGG